MSRPIVKKSRIEADKITIKNTSKKNFNQDKLTKYNFKLFFKNSKDVCIELEKSRVEINDLELFEKSIKIGKNTSAENILQYQVVVENNIENSPFEIFITPENLIRKDEELIIKLKFSKFARVTHQFTYNLDASIELAVENKKVNISLKGLVEVFDRNLGIIMGERINLQAE
ncbi:MAG: hypothetical protein MHMPM18_000210 [Marteilia pararefringens]